MKKVLIVEDSVLIQNILQDALKTCFPCEISLVEDGAKAYAELVRNRYDLVVMDIVMPKMDGLTLAEKVRVELESDVPIIMLTSLSVKNVRDSTSATGVNAYLTKPVDVERLSPIRNRLFPPGSPDVGERVPQPGVETPFQNGEAPPAEVNGQTPDNEMDLPEIEEWTARIDEDW